MANVMGFLRTKLQSGAVAPSYSAGDVTPPEKSSRESEDASLKEVKNNIEVQEAELDSPGQLTLEEGLYSTLSHIA